VAALQFAAARHHHIGLDTMKEMREIALDRARRLQRDGTWK